MQKDFYLLANSHGIALLDALADWRAGLPIPDKGTPNYGTAFRGWFSGAIPHDPFDIPLGEKGLIQGSLTAWLLSGGRQGPALAVRSANGKPVANSALRRVLDAWRGERPIVSMLRGNEHALMSLNHMPGYDFLDEEVVGLIPGVPIIDTQFIDKMIAAWIEVVRLPLAVIRNSNRNPLVHILPPPPREHPERAPYFESMTAYVRQYGFTFATLRLKWYRRYCRQLADELARLGCAVIGPPIAALTPAGLLAEPFAEGLSHGNQKYGALVAAQIDSWLHGRNAA